MVNRRELRQITSPTKPLVSSLCKRESYVHIKVWFYCNWGGLCEGSRLEILGCPLLRAALPRFFQQSIYLKTSALPFFTVPPCRKLRDEYDKLEGALKKLGVDPECVVTEEDEEEDGYNAESDLEEDLERDTEREVATFVPSVYSLPCVQTSSRQPPVTSRLLDRVDEVLTLY